MTDKRCGNCKYLNLENSTSIGYECTKPNAKWRHASSKYHPKYGVACTAYIEDPEKEYVSSRKK